MTTYDNLTDKELLKLIAETIVKHNFIEWLDNACAEVGNTDISTQIRTLNEAVSEAYGRLVQYKAPNSRAVHIGDKVLVNLRVARIAAFHADTLIVRFDDGQSARVSANECQSVPSGLFVLPDERSATGFVFSELPFS